MFEAASNKWARDNSTISRRRRQRKKAQGEEEFCPLAKGVYQKLIEHYDAEAQARIRGQLCEAAEGSSFIAQHLKTIELDADVSCKECLPASSVLFVNL